MSTYNAGEIEASAHLDRDPFIEGLRVCWAEGDRFSRARFTATADIDTRGMARAMAELEAYRAALGRVRADEQRGGADRARLAQAQQRIDQTALRDAQRAAAEQQRLRQDAWRDQQRIELARQALAQRSDQLGRRSTATTKEETKQFQLMRVAIEQLGPPLVPIAGFALAAAAGFAGLGLAGIEAFVGIKKAAEAGTQTGLQYLGILGQLKGANNELAQTAQRGVLAGATEGTAKLLQGLPMVNSLVHDMSVELGDVVQHLAGGLIGGLPNFIGLIHQAADGVDHLAAHFETWASGPAGAHFAATLSQDFEKAGPALTSIWHLLERIIGGVNGPGLAMLTNLGRLSQMLASLPPGVFETLATGYLALRTVVAVTSGIDKATVSWLRLAAAEREATVAGGAAGAGGAARMGLMGKIGRGLGIGLGVSLAAGMVGNMAENSGWNQSMNRGQFALGHIGTALGDINPLGGHFSLSDAYSNVFGAKRAADEQSVEQMKRWREFQGQYVNQGKAVGSIFGGGLGAAIGNLGPVAERTSAVTAITGGSIDSLTYLQHATAAAKEYVAIVGQIGPKAAKALTFDADPLLKVQETLADYTRRQQAAVYKRQTFGTDMAEGLFQVGMQNTTQFSSASSQYDQIDQSLQHAISTRKAWLTQGGTEIFQYKGLSIGAKTFSDALVKTHGDEAKARALIEGTTDAMGHQQTQLDVNVIQQGRVNAALQEAESRYKLTADQVDLYSSVLGINVDLVGRGVVTTQQFASMIGEVAKAVSNGSTAMQGWVGALDAYNQSGKTSADRGALIGQALKAAQGDTLAYENTMVRAATANQQFVTDLGSMKSGVMNLKTGMIDFHNAGAAPILADLQAIQDANVNTAAAIYQHELAQSKDTDTVRAGKKAADDAYNTYVNNTRRSLIDEADKMGLSGAAAKNFIDHYMRIADAPDIKKQIEMIGEDKTQAALKGILEDLDHISGLDHSQVFDITANVSVRGTQAIPGKLLGQLGWAADGAIYAAYANGGTERHIADMMAPRIRVHAEPETGGEAYIPLAPHKRPRSQQIARETVQRLGGVAYFAEGGGYTGVTYPSGGIGSTAPKTSSSSGSSSSAAASGWSASSLSTLKTALAEIEKVLDDAGRKGRTAASVIVNMEQQIMDAAHKAYSVHVVGRSFVDVIAADNAALQIEIGRRDASTQKLADITQRIHDLRVAQVQDSRDVARTVLGTFDPGTAGQGYATGMLSDLHQAADDAKKFAEYRGKALAMGLDPAVIKQIMHEGPATAGANLEAIVKAGRSYIAQYNEQYGRLQYWAGNIGATTGQADYAASLALALRDQAAEQRRNTKYAEGTYTLIKELVADGKTLDARLLAAIRQK